MRAADRILGRSAATQPSGFDVRPFGISKAEAAAIAAAADAAPRPGMILTDGTPVGGRVAGATGASGSGTNLTTSSSPALSDGGRNSGSSLP